MPKPQIKGHSKVKEKPNRLKKWVPTFVLFLISGLLLANTAYYYLNAENFPVGESDLTRTRYDPTNVHIRPSLYSIVGFLPCSVESYIDCEIDLKSMEEVGVKWTQVCHLTDNATTLQLTSITLFPIDYVHDLTLTLNDIQATFFLSNVTGLGQCYTANGFNLTDTGQIETVVTTFNVERAASNNKFVNVPWVFNENYAQFIKFPAINICVEENKTSEESTFKIDYELPFRQLVTGMSGWVDEFDLPFTCWNFYRINSTSVAYSEIFIEYPINQTVDSNGNTYHFKTNFSEQNMADSYMITIIPNSEVILFVIPFMISPFYILGDHEFKKYEKVKNLKGFFRLIYGFGLAYLPIIGFTLVLTGGIMQSLSLLSYLFGIMSLWGFFVLAYPLISYGVLHKTILKTEQES